MGGLKRLRVLAIGWKNLSPDGKRELQRLLPNIQLKTADTYWSKGPQVDLE